MPPAAFTRICLVGEPLCIVMGSLSLERFTVLQTSGAAFCAETREARERYHFKSLALQ